MKENKYDDEKFFDKYSQMQRSQQGLDGAGEWSTLRELLPDFKDKSVLDLGCGYGWHCIYAVDNGASSVIGVDLSRKMLDIAEQKNKTPKIHYLCCAIEDYDYPKECFDVILSSLAFHYVKDYAEVIKKIHSSLKSGGQFIFSVEHPVFTAQGSQQWYFAKDGSIMHFPVDNYYYEGARQAEFLGETVTKYHRTLTTYLDTLLNNEFTLERIVEPKPPESMLHLDGMKDEMRRPMMLIIRAFKK